MRAAFVAAIVIVTCHCAQAMSRMDLPAGYSTHDEYYRAALVGFIAAACFALSENFWTCPRVVRNIWWAVASLVLISTTALAVSL